MKTKSLYITLLFLLNVKSLIAQTTQANTLIAVFNNLPMP